MGSIYRVFGDFLLLIAIIQCNYQLIKTLSFDVTSEISLTITRNRHSLEAPIVIGLFGRKAPKAVANFRHICLRNINGKSYIGTKFHRVIKRFLIQGGDVLHDNGTGFISIYGKHFQDEALDIEHNRPGYVGFVNKGMPNTNGCQFYITTVRADWLNGNHTVFGKIVNGMDTIYAIEQADTDTDNVPVDHFIITKCIEINNEQYTLYPDDFNVYGWIKVISVPLSSTLIILMVFQYFLRQLEIYY